MAKFDTIVSKKENFKGYTGNPPVDEAEYNSRKADMFDGEAPSWSEIQAEITAQDDAVAQKVTDKANAKAKLIAGEALTEAEADTIVL